MAFSSSTDSPSITIMVCINEALTDDELRSVLAKLESQRDKEVFGLVCKRWLHLQSTERKRLSARAGPHMLRKMAARFYRVLELDLSQSISRSFYPGVTDSDLRVIADGFKCLRLLNLHNCKGQQIKVLDINKCSNIGDSGVSSVSMACSSSLKTLKLLDCYKISDESVLSLARFCKNLETLVIGGCRDISDASIKLLAVSCKSNLKNLRMDWCLNISDSSLCCILARCRNLEVLNIGCCEEVTDVAFQGLNGRGDTELSLKFLKVSNCPKVTVAGIAMVLDKCETLEYLDVRSCPYITKAGCEEGGLRFPERCKVNFTGSLAEPEVLLCEWTRSASAGQNL
ncbi:hypothetical protein C1H46_014578 [Malus baccata]|uniref:F-box/LRR-repeat protein 15-like leucin rich repeat domain-containing protein n=1 Tax=Malus baccata TaxID=106549 RepID=A0A540MM30_MALBA|nr:hypothetical protein C1H46_014578 [Malus baccata]